MPIVTAQQQNKQVITSHLTGKQMKLSKNNSALGRSKRHD